jgi:hypothetical protein
MIDLNGFSIGSSESEKDTNWSFMKSLFGRNKTKRDGKGGKMNEEDYGQKKDVIFSQELEQLQEFLSDYIVAKLKKEEPNIGFQLLCTLYKIFTRKE